MKNATGNISNKVGFKLTAEPGSAVFVAGTFNNWDPSQYKLRDNAKRGIYKTTLTLSPGQHEYKFIVNGVWCADPGCPDDVLNVHGTHNSVLRI